MKIALILSGILILACGCTELADRDMADIEQKVAKDSEEQYAIAKKGGSKIDACVHAGMVAAAWLQAKDEGQYNKWKRVEEADCKAAGAR